MSALPTERPGDTVNIGPDGRFDIDRDLICTADASGRFVSLNSAWEKALGWSRHDLTVRPFIDFVHPDDRSRTRLETERVGDIDYELAYGQPIRALRRANGNHAELLARLQPLAPGGDVLLPADFIPEAERLGLIQVVDRWMTEQGLRIAERGGCAQINVSSRSLEDQEFCREIGDRLGAGGGVA
jgi:PAS domain S-box-containing protein